jgi:segregation and condensation protein B
MNEGDIKNVIEAALLATGRPLPLDKLTELFTARGANVERATVRAMVDALSAEYEGRGLEVCEVASGFRIQIRKDQREWLQPLFEERAPRYTRALLETLALIAYRQPITRAEIEDVRGVAVSSNIVRTLMERGWVRVVGYRDVPGKPSMLGTTREFLDYFGLKKLDDLPPLADIKDLYADGGPQSDFLDVLEAEELAQLVALEEKSVLDDDAGDEPLAAAASSTDDPVAGAADAIEDGFPRTDRVDGGSDSTEGRVDEPSSESEDPPRRMTDAEAH